MEEEITVKTQQMFPNCSKYPAKCCANAEIEKMIIKYKNLSNKLQTKINFLSSEIREHRIDEHSLKKELQIAIQEQQDLRNNLRVVLLPIR